MKKGDMKTIISTCCNALTTLYSGDEGTNHYICSNCGEACDFKAGAPVERVERQTGQTMTELNERVVNYFRTYKGMYSQNDVEKLLATARAEGAKEEREKLKRITTTLFELYDKVDGSIKNLHTINQVVGDENRKELENNIRYLLGYISGLKIGLLGDDALTTKEHHAK